MSNNAISVIVGAAVAIWGFSQLNASPAHVDAPVKRVVIEGQAVVAKARVIAKVKPAAVKVVAPAPTPKAKAHKRKAKKAKAKAKAKAKVKAVHVCGCHVDVPYKARNVSGSSHKIKLTYKGFSVAM